MATKPESRLQRRVQEALLATFPDSFILKFHPDEFSAAGTPDLLCCIRGYFIALEVKVPGEEPTALQLDAIERINKAGGFATIVSSPEQAIAFVKTIQAADAI